MFHFHFNETVNYTYETNVILTFSSLVPSLTHFMTSVSPWCNGQDTRQGTQRSSVQIWLWVQLFLLFSYLNMFKLHFNETVNYTYDTKIIFISSSVPSLTQYINCVSLWCNGQNTRQGTQRSSVQICLGVQFFFLFSYLI